MGDLERPRNAGSAGRSAGGGGGVAAASSAVVKATTGSALPPELTRLMGVLGGGNFSE